MSNKKEKEKQFLLILDLDCQQSVKGQGVASITSEIPASTILYLKQCRVIYQSAGSYNYHPQAYLVFDFLGSSNINTNLSRAMIPLAGQSGVDETLLPNIGFTVNKVATKIKWSVVDENLANIQEITNVQVIFEYVVSNDNYFY